jgi:hypothetical protein
MAAARQVQAAAEPAPFPLLDLPGTALERVLVVASDGGNWNDLRSARLVCTRLRAVADFATKVIVLDLSSTDFGLAPLALLPRLHTLLTVQVSVDFDADDDFFDEAGKITQAVCQ